MEGRVLPAKSAMMTEINASLTMSPTAGGIRTAQEESAASGGCASPRKNPNPSAERMTIALVEKSASEGDVSPNPSVPPPQTVAAMPSAKKGSA